ncbi:transposase [Candidatus Parvarchaeota archaeon]|nr:transposase [Candidatus Parvarchaeota archaeon]
MLTAYRFRLYPNEKQQELFSRYFGCSRVVWNKALELRESYYKEHKNDKQKKGLNYYDTARFLRELKQKEEYKWLKEANSQSLQQTLMDLDKAFNAFFKGISKYPKYKKKTNKQSFRVPQFFNFTDNLLYLPKMGKGIRMEIHREFPRGKVKQLTVTKTPTGKYFVSLVVDDRKETPQKVQITNDPDKSIGIDMGLKDFAILSNGIKISNPKFLQKSEKLLKRRQKQLSRKQKDSKNRAKARISLAKIYERITNQRNDFIHKVSTAITKRFDTIVVETLNIKGMKKNHNLAKAISNVSWSRFFEFIKYKAEKQGKNIIEIGMFEKSSKTCSVCGHVNKGLTLKEREWTCTDCNTLLDRDINAAINIRNFGLNQIGLKSIPSDRGEFKPVENSLTAELAKMKIKARSTSHDPEKQELYAMKKLKLLIGAGSP